MFQLMRLTLLLVILTGALCGCTANEPHATNEADQYRVVQDVHRHAKDSPNSCNKEFEVLWDLYSTNPHKWRTSMFHMIELGAPPGCEFHYFELVCKLVDIQAIDVKRDMRKHTIVRLDGVEVYLNDWLLARAPHHDSWEQRWNFGKKLLVAGQERRTLYECQ